MKSLLLGIVGALGLTVSANATTVNGISYTVNRTIVSGTAIGTVVGTITTDGTIGTLTANNVLKWNLLLTGADGSTYDLTTTHPGVKVRGNDLTADAINLYFNFDGTDNGVFLLQTNLNLNGNTYYCDTTTTSVMGPCDPGEAVVPKFFLNLPSTVDDLNITGNQIIGDHGIVTTVELPVPTPIPATLPLLAGALGLIGLFGRSSRRSRLFIVQ